MYWESVIILCVTLVVLFFFAWCAYVLRHPELLERLRKRWAVEEEEAECKKTD